MITTIINPEYEHLKPFIEAIPDIFQKEGETVYQARNQLKSFNVDGLEVIVKSFKKPHLLNRFVYSFLRPSKARRSYEYAFKLLERGVPTPAPIAYMEEKKNGLLNRSFYISVYESSYNHIRFYMNGDIKDDILLDKLAGFIADFHNKEINHLDISPGNILFKRTGDDIQFMLIDINRMKFMPMENQERYKSLKRLSATTDVINSFAPKYAQHCRLNTDEATKQIKKYSSDFFKTTIK